MGEVIFFSPPRQKGYREGCRGREKKKPCQAARLFTAEIRSLNFSKFQPKPRCLIIRSLSYLSPCLPPYIALRVNIIHFMLPSPPANAVIVWLSIFRLSPHFVMRSILKTMFASLTLCLLTHRTPHHHPPTQKKTHPFGLFQDVYIYSQFNISMYV